MSATRQTSGGWGRYKDLVVLKTVLRIKTILHRIRNSVILFLLKGPIQQHQAMLHQILKLFFKNCNWLIRYVNFIYCKIKTLFCNIYSSINGYTHYTFFISLLKSSVPKLGIVESRPLIPDFYLNNILYRNRITKLFNLKNIILIELKYNIFKVKVEESDEDDDIVPNPPPGPYRQCFMYI